MLSPSLTLPCGPCGRLAWHPSGAWLAAALAGGTQVALVDVARAAWQLWPGRWVGPWSPDGGMVLAHDGRDVRVLSWPDARTLARLPSWGWVWTAAGTLLAVHGHRLWRVQVGEPAQPAQHDTDGRWGRVVPLMSDPEGVVGLRWRPSLAQWEAATWTAQQPRPDTLVRPALTDWAVGPWAWSDRGDGWVAAGGPEGCEIKAWSFPQGWPVADLRSEQRVRGLAHWGHGVAWLQAHELVVWPFETHIAQTHRVTLGSQPRPLAWSDATATLAVAGAQEVSLFPLRGLIA